MNEDKLFKVFAEAGCGDLTLYNKVKGVIDSEVYTAEGEMASSFYDCLTRLLNNENNAGWEERQRHSARIGIMQEMSSSLTDKYGDFI